jgi:hypothetical protein
MRTGVLSRARGIDRQVSGFRRGLVLWVTPVKESGSSPATGEAVS